VKAAEEREGGEKYNGIAVGNGNKEEEETLFGKS
jgi:hypothetical protein